MSAHHDLAIAFAIAQSVQEQAASFNHPIVTKVDVTNGPTTAKQRKAATAKATPVPPKTVKDGTALALGLILPEKGSLEALGFLKAMANAGKRNFTVQLPSGESRIVIKVDHTKTRNDQIQAIAAYLGYDPRVDFGPQEVAARAQAQRDIRPIRPIQGKEYKRSYTVDGVAHVKGLPNFTQRRIQDLLAREQVCTDEIIKHRTLAQDNSAAPNDRQLAIGLWHLEEERLRSVRSDLELLNAL